MQLSYFKRYRMEISLAGRDLLPRPVAPEYRFLPWEPSLLDALAQGEIHQFSQ